MIAIGLGAMSPERRPRVAARGYSLVREGGGRTDLVVFAARGEEVVDLRAPAGTLLRPVAGPAGRIAPYVLEDARVLRDVALGRGKLAFVRFARDFTPVLGGEEREADLPLEVAFEVDGGRVRLEGGREEPLSALWDRFRTDAPTHPLSDRGRLLRRLVRPATRPGRYGVLARPPELPAAEMGVESAGLRWAVLVP
jgi:hypothetical protein